jgi:hypothetical protein
MTQLYEAEERNTADKLRRMRNCKLSDLGVSPALQL